MGIFWGEQEIIIKVPEKLCSEF